MRNSRRGNYAILVAVSITTLLGFAALAIDLSYLRVSEAQAQNAADAGAHAALVELSRSGDEDEARLVAVDVLKMNLVAGDTVDVEAAEDITFGAWDYSSRSFDPEAEYANAVSVRVRRTDDAPDGPIQLFLAPFVGTEFAEASSFGASVGALRYREIMVVQDVTGSFMDEIDEAREADLALLDYIYDNRFPGDRVGMVNFVGGAELWTELSYVDTDYSSMRSQWETLDWCDRSYSPWNFYFGGRFYHESPTLECRTDGPNAYADSGTSQGAGLEMAIEELLAEGDDNAVRSIIVVSDGKPQCVGGTAYQNTLCSAERAAFGLEMADWAYENGISVYSVSFNNETDPDDYYEQSEYMESLIRGDGKFYETPDEEELPDIMLTIAASIPISIVE